MLSIINIYSVFLSLLLFVSDSGKLADMRKKIKTVILLVTIAMVTALLVHSYSHAMVPQDLVSNMRAKYLGFSGVKGRVDLWNEHHTSLLQQGKCELVLLKQRLKGYM